MNTYFQRKYYVYAFFNAKFNLLYYVVYRIGTPLWVYNKYYILSKFAI